MAGFRVDPQLWEQFAAAAEAAGTARGEALRAFIRWYLRKPGAELPERPPAEEH